MCGLLAAHWITPRPPHPIHINTQSDNVEENIQNGERLVREAAAQGAQVYVLMFFLSNFKFYWSLLHEPHHVYTMPCPYAQIILLQELFAGPYFCQVRVCCSTHKDGCVARLH